MTPLLAVITGPTAVGKTALCVDLAKHFKTDIVSADSRQFFNELSIGTAKPTPKEMDGVRHHFINSHSIQDDFNVSDFEKDGISLLNKLFKDKQVVLLTGGSGLYIDAVCEGLDQDLPGKDESLRTELEQLYQQYGIEILQQKLKELDPEFYKEIDLNNITRLYRAIEVCILSGVPYSTLRKGNKQERDFEVIKIVLNRDREELFERINKRVDSMIEQGLVSEAKSVMKFRNMNALKTVGYTELFDHFDNKTSLEQAIENIKVNSRRYAKRQLNWFKRDNSYHWFHPNEKQAIVDLLSSKLNGYI